MNRQQRIDFVTKRFDVLAQFINEILVDRPLKKITLDSLNQAKQAAIKARIKDIDNGGCGCD